MACKVFRVGKIWHYRFQVGTVRTQRSTRERNRDRAEAIAQRIYADAITLANGGHPIPTLSELIAEWVVVRAPIASQSHRQSIGIFARLHLYDLGDLPINKLTTIKIEQARNMHLRTKKPASANHWLRIVKLLVNWAVKRDIVPKLPWQVKLLSVQRRPRAMLPVASARQWIDAIDNASRHDSVGTAVRMMFGLGLRESEASGARWEWLDWQRASYTPGVTKGKEAEPVSVPDWLLNHLAAKRQTEGWIAPRSDGSRHSPGFARRAMTAANKACDIKGITPHRLRGTFATLLAESGVPIQEIQRVMRHKSALTTMGYLEKSIESTILAQNSIAQKIGF